VTALVAIDRDNTNRPILPTSADEQERFWSRVDKAGDGGCWLWTGNAKSRDYGVVPRNRGSVLAHRYSWALANGREIPAGLVVMHTCDNPPCVNPAHLTVGTQADNIRDAKAKNRILSEKNRAARSMSRALTDEQIAEIRAAYSAGGETHRSLAQRYGVSHGFIQKVITGRRRSA
jgi:hypothetical protein